MKKRKNDEDKTRIIHTKKTTMISPKTKVKGMIWVFHKGDDDNQPSVPHGHSQDGKYKMQLWSGNIYNVRTGKLEYQAKKKEIKALRNYPGFMEFVEECREEYKQRNPSIVLPELSYSFYKSGKQKRKFNYKNQFVFFIRHNKRLIG